MSVNSVDPQTLFSGTTWVQIKDKFLIAAGDSYTVGTDGGAATHTLTTDEMPAHTHTFTGTAVTSENNSANPSVTVKAHNHTSCWTTVNNVQGGNRTVPWMYNDGDFTNAAFSGGSHAATVSGTHTHTVTAAGTNANAGGGNAFSIMPPYTPVYMWRRTA